MLSRWYTLVVAVLVGFAAAAVAETVPTADTCDTKCRHRLLFVYCNPAGTTEGMVFFVADCLHCGPAGDNRCDYNKIGQSGGTCLKNPKNVYQEIYYYDNMTAYCDCSDASAPNIVEASAYGGNKTKTLVTVQFTCQ
jgi:hypothetical protein